jgi:hypothetical protein
LLNGLFFIFCSLFLEQTSDYPLLGE